MIDSGIRAVFFDAVGTLLHPRTPVSQTYADHAHRLGVDLSEDQVRLTFRTAFARQEAIDLEAGWRTDETRERIRWQTIVADVLSGDDADRCFPGLWEWFRRPDSWIVQPETGPVLVELARRGLILGLASNFDARLLSLVEAHSELGLVRGRCVVSSLVGWRKPSPRFFAALVETAGCDPGQILYVGDDLRNDFEGAVGAGLRAVLLDPQGQSPGPNRIRRLRDLLAA